MFNTPKGYAEDFAKNNNCRVFDTYEEMLNRGEIDVVSICTPSGTHAPLAIEAANHGKNVIVEKPVAITQQQIDDIVAAVEKNNVKLSVISQLRFDKNIQKVKKAIENGELGDLIIGDIYMKYYRAPEYYSSSGWRGTWAMDGGGALMNQGIHGIDILQYLVGPVKSVLGICKTLARDIEVEERGEILTIYGCCGVDEFNYAVHLLEGFSALAQSDMTGAKFIGETKNAQMYSVDFENGIKGIYKFVTGKWYPFNFTIMTTTNTYVLDVDPNGLYVPMLREICKQMTDGESKLCDVEKIINCTEVMLCGKKSKEQFNGADVTIDMLDETDKFDGYAFEAEYGANAGVIYKD